MQKVAAADNCSNLFRILDRFFPVLLDRFRALRESCVLADQSCCNFFIPVKLTPFDDRPDD